MLIVGELLIGTKRFGELHNALGGVSQKVLTQHLRAMAQSGLVQRKAYAEVLPRVEYTLTPTGKSPQSVHNVLWAWGTAYQAAFSVKRKGARTSSIRTHNNNDKADASVRLVHRA